MSKNVTQSFGYVENRCGLTPHFILNWKRLSNKHESIVRGRSDTMSKINLSEITLRPMWGINSLVLHSTSFLSFFSSLSLSSVQ